MMIRSCLTFLVLILASWISSAHSTVAAEITSHRPPNIVFVLIDDLGKEWISCYGAEGIETPHVDALASTGMRFEHAYSMPQCTPSRVCLLTGQYPFRNGWVNHWDVPRWGVGYFDWNQYPCLPQILKSAGYATAIAGKWQINDFRVHPSCLVDMGFDDYCMWTGGEGSLDDPKHETISTRRYWDPYIHTKTGSRTYPGKFGPDIYNRFVLDFITKHEDEPFFIYYPMALTHGPLVHTPLDPSASTPVEKHRAMVRYADFLLGKLVQHLDKLKLRGNTVIIWTTDNGTSRGLRNRMNGRMVRGGKGLTTENGINAPFIASCPGLIPENTTSQALVDFTDILPTFAELAGVDLPEQFKYDGHSFANVLTGTTSKSPRQWILAMGGQPGVATDAGIENVFWYRDRVLRDERYKLFVDTNRKPQKLIDLQNDPEEQHNLINRPERATTLQKLSDPLSRFPLVDADPKYENHDSYPIYRRKIVKSKSHKR